MVSWPSKLQPTSYQPGELEPMNEVLESADQMATQWASKHASEFAPSKFQLTHFTRTRRRFDMERPLAGFEKTLGPDHDSTLWTVNRLGDLYKDQCKLADAE
jgi:hypothetical protein